MNDKKELHYSSLNMTYYTGAFTTSIFLIIFGLMAIFLNFVVGFLILLIPTIILTFIYLLSKNTKLIFFKNRIVIEKGLLSKSSENYALTKILSVKVRQSIFGRIFNYGSLVINKIGNEDIRFNGIVNPIKSREFLEKMIDSTDYDKLMQTIHD